jgi:DNA-directed RNA polymerase specialized sigma subunit
LYRLYYEDKTQTQIARELGLTPGRISQVKQAGLEVVADIIERQERR